MTHANAPARSDVLSIRLRAGERMLLNAAARLADRPVADFARAAILAAVRRELEHPHDAREDEG